MVKLRQENEKKTVDADNNAKVMKKIRAEIQTLQDQLTEGEHMKVELAEARAELRKQRNSIEADNQELRLSQEKLSQSMHENSSLRLELNAISSKYNTVSAAYDVLKVGTDTQMKQIQRLEQESSLINMEKSILNRKVLDLEETLESTRLELETLKKLHQRLEVSLDAAKTDHDSTTQLMMSQHETLKAEIEYVTNQLVTATKGISEKETLIEAATNQIHTLKLNQSQSTLTATVAIESMMANSQYLSTQHSTEEGIVQVTFSKHGESFFSSSSTQTDPIDSPSSAALLLTSIGKDLISSITQRKVPSRRRSIPFSCKFGIETQSMITIATLEDYNIEKIESLLFSQGIEVSMVKKQSVAAVPTTKSSLKNKSLTDKVMIDLNESASSQKSPPRLPQAVTETEYSQATVKESHISDDASVDEGDNLQQLRLHDTTSGASGEPKQFDTARSTMSNMTEVNAEENAHTVDESAADHPSISASGSKEKGAKKGSYISVEKSNFIHQNQPTAKETTVRAVKTEAVSTTEHKSASAEAALKVVAPKKKPTAFRVERNFYYILTLTLNCFC